MENNKNCGTNDLVMEISQEDVTGNVPGEFVNAVQGENVAVEQNAVPAGNNVGVPSVVSSVNTNVNNVSNISYLSKISRCWS